MRRQRRAERFRADHMYNVQRLWAGPLPAGILRDHAKVPTLEQEDEILAIPAGTQTGSTFRVKGRGVSKRGGSARGDIFVTVDIVVPTKLTRDQKDLLTKFGSTIETENKPIQRKI